MFIITGKRSFISLYGSCFFLLLSMLMPGCSCLVIVPPATFAPAKTVSEQGGQKDATGEPDTTTPQEPILTQDSIDAAEPTDSTEPAAFPEEPVSEPAPEPTLEQPPADPCQPSPCHARATCTSQDGKAVCRCLPGYEGDGFTCKEVAVSLNGLRWELPCRKDWEDRSDVCYCPKTVQSQTQLKGSAQALYAITLRFRGVVELKTYNGGSHDGAYWQVGGTPKEGAWNVYRLSISNPPQTFYLNRGPSGEYYCVSVDYTKTIQAYGNATFALFADSVEDLQIKNLDKNGQPILIPDVKPYPNPYNGQFVQMDVVQIVRIR